MIINTKVIAEFKFRKDRFNNFKKHYNNKDFTPAQFLGLRNISHEDKVWIAFRLMRKDLIPLCAADMAELILPVFEAQYPKDRRPHKAIEAARANTTTEEEKERAVLAIYASISYATASYASYVYYMVPQGSRVLTSSFASASAASYASFASSVYSAANFPYISKKNSNKKIRTIVLKYLNRSEK